MIHTYDGYLKEKNSMTFDEMQQIHNDMISEIGTDEDAIELYDELVSMAVKYAGIRSKWLRMKRQERMDHDGRSKCHDSFIVKCNKLARYLKMTEKEAHWRTELGDESVDPQIRKRIGDFACYIAFINGLSTR